MPGWPSGRVTSSCQTVTQAFSYATRRERRSHGPLATWASALGVRVVGCGPACHDRRTGRAPASGPAGVGP